MEHNLLDKTNRFKSFEKDLESFGHENLGLTTPREILIENVSEYFENKENIPLIMKMGTLNFECEFLFKKSSVSWIADLIKTMLAEFRLARDYNPVSFFNLWVEQIDFLSGAVNNYGRTAELQHDKSKLELDLRVRSMFRDIGDLLEGTVQRYLRTRLNIWIFLSWHCNSQKKLGTLDFGEVTRALDDNPRSAGVYKPIPFSLLVSQWRNIANHNSYEYENGKITCTYGKGEKSKKIDVTIEEFEKLYNYCNDLAYAHKIAVEIFTADNVAELSKNPPKFTTTAFSVDAIFAYGLIASGFSFKHVSYESGENWFIDLIDSNERSANDAKVAIQEACHPVLIERGYMHVTARVFSGNEVHSFSFAGVAKT